MSAYVRPDDLATTISCDHGVCTAELGLGYLTFSVPIADLVTQAGWRAQLTGLQRHYCPDHARSLDLSPR